MNKKRIFFGNGKNGGELYNRTSKIRMMPRLQQMRRYHQYRSLTSPHGQADSCGRQIYPDKIAAFRSPLDDLYNF